VKAVGLDPAMYGTHEMRRTKASLIYRRTNNLQAVQLLLDLYEDLNGKHRDIALAIHQLSELGVLLTAKLLDRETRCPGQPAQQAVSGHLQRLAAIN